MDDQDYQNQNQQLQNTQGEYDEQSFFSWVQNWQVPQPPQPPQSPNLKPLGGKRDLQPVSQEIFEENQQNPFNQNVSENPFSIINEENQQVANNDFQEQEQAGEYVQNNTTSDSKIIYPKNWESYDLRWKMLSIMVENQASDCYPVVDYNLWVKISWSINWAERLWILSKETVSDFLDSIFTEKQKTRFKEELEIDFAYEWVDEFSWEHFRFRVNAFHQGKNPSATLRYLRADIKSLDDLWVPPILKELAERNSWIVLLCWVTWSWKSTTIAWMVDHINSNFSKHIISIEDPVEYTFDKKKSWIEQREVWTDTISFGHAMKSALRQNPNVLFLWEMRDLESIGSAISIAESGHLVLSTIHARNSEQCINKIIDSFPWDQQNQVRLQLSEALAWIVTQKLIPKKDWKWLQLVMEVLVNNSAVWNLIRENQVHQLWSIIQTWKQEWMKLLDEDILDVYKEWKISAYNAVKHSNNPGQMRKVFFWLWVQV